MKPILSESGATAATVAASTRSALTLAMALCIWPAAQAQTLLSSPVRAGQPLPPMPAALPAPVFPIRGFDVTGDNPLSAAQTTAVLAPFLREDATLEKLQEATSALEAALRERGFGLHRVSLPPQELGKSVQLQIVRFVVGKITIEGANNFDATNIRNSLPELAEGSSPNFKTLAVQTAIANESPSKQVQVALKAAEQPDRIDATVRVKDTRPWNLALSLSNAGSEETGEDRFTVAGSHANLFNRDHQFVGAYTTALTRLSDVKQLGLSYRVPLYAAGGVVSLQYTYSDVAGDFGAFSSSGKGSTLGAQYTHYLEPDGKYRSYVSLGVQDKVFGVTEINGVAIASQRERRSRPLTLGYNGRLEGDNSQLTFSADLSANLGGGEGNNLAAYQSEDPRISTYRWSALRLNGGYTLATGGNWIYGLRGQMQLSGDALISGEQFGLGGAGSVRGTGERVISGDRGLFLSLEVNTPELARGLRLAGFADGGWLANNDPNAGSRPASDRIGSAGLGLRYATGNLSLSLDYARVLKGSRVPLTFNSNAPQRDDEKLHLNFTARF